MIRRTPSSGRWRGGCTCPASQEREWEVTSRGARKEGPLGRVARVHTSRHGHRGTQRQGTSLPHCPPWNPHLGHLGHVGARPARASGKLSQVHPTEAKELSPQEARAVVTKRHQLPGQERAGSHECTWTDVR